MTTVRLAALAASVLLITVGGVACAIGQPSGSPTASSGGTTPLGSTPTAPAMSSTVTQPPAAAPPPVEYAIVSAVTANSVSWTDGKQVPATVNNSRIEALPGAAHQHTASLSPDARFYLPEGPNGLALDDHGAGTNPADRATFAAYVVGAVNQAPRLTFDAQGRIISMAAHFHP